MSALEIWQWDCPSQEFEGIPRLMFVLDELILEYNYEGPDGAYIPREAKFQGAVGYRFTASDHCTMEQLAAYDRLLEIKSSTWIADIQNPRENLRHYRVFFDDYGCYEVLASLFLPPIMPLSRTSEITG